MKLDTVHVEHTGDYRRELFAAQVAGMSVFVREEHAAEFDVGKACQLGQGKERYRVLIIEKHPVTGGACLFLKKWDPS